MRKLSLLLALLAGCHDGGFVYVNLPPNVVLTAPLDAAEVDENSAVFFEGVIDDDGPLAGLSVDWIDSVSGVMAENVEIEEDGMVRVVTSTLTPGEHTIVLRAIDSDAEVGEDSIAITVMPVPERPSVAINHPDLLGTEKGLEGQNFIFMATVADRQDAVEDLTVEVVASPYGLVCTMFADGSGVAQCPAVLPIGEYNLAFTVTDSDGNQSIANAPFGVVARGDYDFDGDGFTPNGGDCNDSSATIYPGAPEVCDGMDNDCMPATTIDVGTECYDDDGDGYCERPPCVNTSQTLADCDDASPERFPNPAAPEVVNGLDDDCDSLTDEGTVVYDDDSDGYCESPPCINASGTSPDCNDGAVGINPGTHEICGDGIDNNCNTLTNERDAVGCTGYYKDVDGDTWGITGGTQCYCDAGLAPYTGLNTQDCYDANPSANPAQTGYFPTSRGDGSFDYNCDSTQQKLYLGHSNGCAWEIAPFSCDVLGEGWVSNSVPSCGSSGAYVPDCSGSYDAFCYYMFYLGYGNLSDCSTCDPETTNYTQVCR